MRSGSAAATCKAIFVVKNRNSKYRVLVIAICIPRFDLCFEFGNKYGQKRVTESLLEIFVTEFRLQLYTSVTHTLGSKTWCGVASDVHRSKP